MPERIGGSMSEEQMADRPKTSVVIPNYNGIEYITDCLDALMKQHVMPDRILVIDNGSTDGSAEAAEEFCPQAELIRMGTNTGFCGAVNAGIRASEGMDYVILLNNDTKVLPDFTGELIRAMERAEDIFSCQAKMLCMADPSLVDDAGDLYCALGWAFARGKGRQADRYRKPAAVFSCCAGAAIYRTSLLKETGLFDEAHFAYLEDTDLGWRARLLGYRNLFIPTAKVLHVGSASSGSIYNLFKVINTSRNSVYVILKNMPVWQILLNLPFLIPGFAVKAGFFSIRGYGKEYLNGLKEGLRMGRQARKEGRCSSCKDVPPSRFVRLQLEMWGNIPRRLTGE